ncbi:nuclear transport factor 2 family protein [uncultured Jannaschia sp.]|uniref:nuclear transport factor 2 family protein n=1 Tax=uncultured Jannaschia sp. TaxID=293347 RepID=UPI0026066D21|nr:nuclear transport factor 2 family protein [uncultured Jannaschia sp.]
MNFETMMQANLERVFDERDEARRPETIRELYGESAELHDPNGTVQGHDAINRVVTELLTKMPPDLAFVPIRPALALGSFARLHWRSGLPEGPRPSRAPMSRISRRGGYVPSTSSSTSPKADPWLLLRSASAIASL